MKALETKMFIVFGHWKAQNAKYSRVIIMAENQRNTSGSLFCQTTRLSQSVVDLASVSLVDNRQNTIQRTRTGQKFRKNTLEESASNEQGSQN